jgi:hypothetical protein
MDPEHAMHEFIKRAKESKKAGQGAHKVAQSVQKSAYDGKTVLRGWSGPKPYGSNYQAKEAVAHNMIFRMRQACA